MRRIHALISLVALGASGALQAHHAPAVFDQSKTIVVEGTVTEFVWQNPHSWIRMDVVDANGKTTNWSMEMNPPTYLIKSGWKATTLKPGDKIRVVANPLRTGEPAGKFINVTLPDGRVLGEADPILGEK